MENRDNQFQKQEERQEERMENRTYQENNHNPQLDEEVAQEVAPNPALAKDRRENNKRKEEAGGFGIGLTALILSVLSFFVWPFVLSIAGIIVGIFAVRKKSALGWWAIAVGIVALIVALFLFPFRLLF